ncbi:TetR/AcrR family transcriptional regulator [Gordonia sp. NPDC058843]|uniref:TetR/AcrR family transcriptional regulator n=1 Tax=Gordonia sp. NPDC058843 TaxID=3346648 RepID=UPI00368B62D8
MTTRRRARSPRGSGEILAEEIIEAAGDLLVENGDDTAMSIRAVANRVGVTPPSIYLHFADKEALLDAVCARYFERLDDEMAAASEGVGDALERALSQGMAYVRFAVATPVLYRVAFGKPTSEGHPSKVDQVLAASAYSRFAGTVTELADDGVFDRGEIADVVLEFWAAAHGVASLMLAKPGLAWGDDFARAESMLTAICLGRAALGTGDGVDQTAVRSRLRTLRERVN